MTTPRRFLRCLVLVATCAALAAAPSHHAGFRLVPEMETPEGIQVQSRQQRRGLADDAAGQRGLARLAALVGERWERLRGLDIEALSRHQLEATRGFRLPAAPGELTGQVLAREPDSGRLHLELSGPRLPARFEIVHRHLTFYAVYDPATEALGELTVTIRGWVLE